MGNVNDDACFVYRDVDEAILRRLPRSFEIGLPNIEQRVDILKVILKDEVLEDGFFGPGSDPPVRKIAKATESYSGSDLKELCKAAAMAPVRDLLANEARERVVRLEEMAAAPRRRPVRGRNVVEPIWRRARES